LMSIASSIGLSWSIDHGEQRGWSNGWVVGSLGRRAVGSSGRRAVVPSYRRIVGLSGRRVVRSSGRRVAHTVICALSHSFVVPHGCFWNIKFSIVNCE
jgi:hypothetical protein